MKSVISILMVLTGVLFVSPVTEAAILSVPHEYPTIQAGIDAATDGDIIRVADGVYTGAGNRDIHYYGKKIRVESVSGPDACIIDCQGSVSDPHTGFIFDTDEASDSVLIGVTIRNGYAAPGTVTNGGAINCYGSNPTLINCVFHDNTAENGGALYILYNPSTMYLFNCLFYNNTAGSDGGGLSANLALVNLRNCTFAGNTAFSGAGIHSWHSGLDMHNCIVWDNLPDGMYILGSLTPEITYCDIQGGYTGEGNIDTDPLFVTFETADYLLSQTAAGQVVTSPCADAGYAQAAATCFDLDELFNCLNEATTRTDWVNDALQVDMGFHYGFQPWIAPTPTPTPTMTPTITPTPTPHDTIRRVPEDYATIQDAIDVAVDGDTVSVADGVYTGTGNRDIHYYGRAITVASRNGPDACIIDCQGTEPDPHRGFTFENGETSASVLDGFTIKNGYFEGASGGGIACDWDTCPRIMNCIITDNYAWIGGGVELGGGTLLNSIITDNVALGNWYLATAGGGVSAGSGTISGCIIRNNTALSERPGGIICFGNVLIENCVIDNNNKGPGIDVYCDHIGYPCGTVDVVNCLITGHEYKGVVGAYNPDYQCTIMNSIVWGNEIPGVSSIDVSYCNIEGGAVGEGNIDADPLLVMDADWGYYLSQQAAGQETDSPCLDAGMGLASQTFVTGPDGPVPLSTLTTRTDHAADTGKVDMGPHLTVPDTTVPTLVTGVAVYMPSNSFVTGDRFRCEAIVNNATGEALNGYPLFVLLESYGQFFFAPSFSADADHYLDEYPSFPEGDTLVIVLPEFFWPNAGYGTATWVAALTDPGMSSLYGEWDMRSFTWE